MLRILHYIIVVAYIALPVAALGWDLLQARRRRTKFPSRGLITNFSLAILLGTGLCVAYSLLIGGWARITQVALACYFAAGLLLVLKGFDWIIRAILIRIVLSYHGRGAKPRAGSLFVDWLAALARVVILVMVGLPYVMAAVMTYRPKVHVTDDPSRQLGYRFEPVSFRSTDGINLSGWWIPGWNESNDHRTRSSNDIDRTVIICHGLAASKSNQLVLSRFFAPEGYNVLIFDFRAHGDSGGQLSSIGDLERFDVLGAVRWLRAHHPQQAREIYGVGISMGGAALIGAAADPSEEGRAIDAIAVYDTFDSLPRLTHRLARSRFIPPLSWALQWLALPFASAQVGVDLNHFVPANIVQNVWPRPVMVVHGTADEIIEYQCGLNLYNSITGPKDKLWIEGADHNSVIHSDPAGKAVREFFDNAEPMPVI